MADQQFVKTPDTGHWYQLLPDGRIEARYEANLRTARQEKLYPSVTEVEGSTRANPTLLRWLKKPNHFGGGQNPPNCRGIG